MIYTPETLKALICESMDDHVLVNGPQVIAHADAWEALEKRFAEEVEWDNKRADKLATELEAKYDELLALRKRLEEAERNFQSLGKLACCCGVITSEDSAEWERLQASLAPDAPKEET